MFKTAVHFHKMYLLYVREENGFFLSKTFRNSIFLKRIIHICLLFQEKRGCSKRVGSEKQNIFPPRI